MTEDGRCTSCGARMPAADGACPYCGAAVTAPVAVAAAPDPAAERAAALAAVRAHPSFDALVRDVPPLPGWVHVGYVLPIFVGTVFIAVPAVIAVGGGVIANAVSGSSGFGLGLTLAIVAFCALFMLIGVAVIVMGVRTRRKLVGGIARAVPAVVLAKRTETGDKATAYYVALGFEGGERHEFGTLDSVFRSAFEGDAGVAHCRGELLLAFRKAAVSA